MNASTKEEVRQGLNNIVIQCVRLMHVLEDDPVGKLYVVDFADKRVVRTVDDGQPLPSPVETILTFGAWLDYWYQTFKAPKLKDSTRRNYELYITDNLKPALGRYRLDEITGPLLQEYLLTVENENTRKKIAYMLRPALKKAVVCGKLDRNPFDAVELPGYEYEHYRPLEFVEQNAVLDAVRNNPTKNAIFWVLACTGLRIGEFLALDFEKDVDYDERFISVSKNMDIKTGKIITPKTKKGRRKIPFLPELLPYLSYLRDSGLRFTYSTVRCYFWRIYRKLGFRGLNLHSLRHTFISLCYYVGIREKYIQTMVGHSKIDTTLDIYTHVLKRGSSPLEDYVRELGKLFN